MTDLAQMQDKTKPRLSSEDRVFKPYPLKRVIILGMGASVSDYINMLYSSPTILEEDFEVWTINCGCAVFDHDVVFNMHDLDVLEKLEPEKKFKDLYNSHNKPVVTVRPWEGAGDNVKEYPLYEVLEAFGQDYFAGGIAYMVAFALLCDVEEIYIFGCDFSYDDDSSAYERGRPNLEFWLGYAAARGVRISVATSSTLIDTSYRLRGNGAQGFGKVYGYFDRQPVYEWKPLGDCPGFFLELKNFKAPKLKDHCDD